MPWDDLKYLFGEILYGGHIVEDWDRRLAYMYLELYMREDLLEGIEMFPRFSSPPSGLSHKSTLEYIAEVFPTESPLAFGLHPNAEIGFKLREAESLCASLLLLQPRESGGEAGASVEDKAKMVLDDVVERLPENFDVEDIRGRVDEVTPYVMVAIQEVERMNVLLSEIKRSLAELDLGLKGDLTMTDPMEVVMRSLANDVVPPSWAKNAWPSLRPLGSWLQNLQQRITQLSDWTVRAGVARCFFPERTDCPLLCLQRAVGCRSLFSSSPRSSSLPTASLTLPSPNLFFRRATSLFQRSPGCPACSTRSRSLRPSCRRQRAATTGRWTRLWC